ICGRIGGSPTVAGCITPRGPRDASIRRRQKKWSTNSPLTPAHVCSAGGDAQVAEVGFSTGADPQSYLTADNTSFQVVHDQRRLWRAVDEQPGPHAVDVDAEVRPDSRFEVDVRFVDARVLSSKLLPGELRW